MTGRQYPVPEHLEQLAEAALLAWQDGSTVEAAARPYAEAAALAAVAFAQVAAGEVPPRLRARLLADGLAFCAERRQTGRQRTGQAPAGARLRVVGDGDVETDRDRDAAGGRAPFWLGSLLGVAAGVVASLALLRSEWSAPSATAQRELLIARGAEPRPWQPGPSTAHGTISGDVTWSTADQSGYLRIQGLRPLDAEHEYQLWIVDGTRTAPQPVDGGLFTLPSAGEHVVPIDARLPVGEAKAFVITVEQKGGVVVSLQQDVVAIAN